MIVYEERRMTWLNIYPDSMKNKNILFEKTGEGLAKGMTLASP
ncbi:hypothetical protein SAMN05421736_10961 [Evansella caseinilytica]|uniref:Uncharacterized protein n=1 Tax=Evansella caseinilytica TaxID=1503961 RepID=A0A1H3RVJ5_9BACI|nr:hypothetical protein SAMN05421736_10961 [Evansella caseinilytica]